MADQAPDKVDATAPAVEAPAASTDNVTAEQGEAVPKVQTKVEEGNAATAEKSEGEDQSLSRVMW